MEDTKIENWVPYKLIKTDGQLQCHWLNTYGKQFIEPFFEETILKCRSINNRHFSFSSVSDLRMIDEWAQSLDKVEPAAFIFHTSRCGSTLISQLLATSEANIVLSEVPIFDDILRLHLKESDFDQTDNSELLANAIKFHGQKKTGREKHLWIKTDSWHLFFYKQLRQLYPSTPFVFIYRSPDEVFSSHRKLPGMQSVRGLIELEVFGFNAEEIADWHPDIYLSKVLESYFRQCLDIIDTDNKFLLLNYNEEPIPMIKKIAAFTNAALSGQDLSKMTERSLYHSKKPGERFNEETITNIPLCLERAMELYAELEEKRMAASFS